jgi:hypothetical protein
MLEKFNVLPHEDDFSHPIMKDRVIEVGLEGDLLVGLLTDWSLNYALRRLNVL